MKTLRGTTTRLAMAIAGATLGLALGATGAYSHSEDYWPITGDSLKMTSWPGASKTSFKFKTKAQLNVNAVSISHDPREDGATLTVRGTGAFAGTSGVVHLKNTNWAPIGSELAPKGWKYKGQSVEADGVTKVTIKTGSSGGAISIQAKDAYWPFDIDGPQDSIEFVLTIGEVAFCTVFSASNGTVMETNETGTVVATGSPAPATCPVVCDNGVLEEGEECDDGNGVDDDTCSNSCIGCTPEVDGYESTYEAIQDLIFDNPAYNCTNAACHGSATPAGDLDLRAGFSHAALVNVNSSTYPSWNRVFPGDQDLSLLYTKVADRVNGTSTAPGTSMPVGGSALTAEHLEALRLWIRGGAPETGSVAGTAELLDSCLPPPTPLDIPQPPVPNPSVGTQFAMPGYTLHSDSETEGCVASYYDVSATVPESMLVDCPNAFPGTNETGFRAGKCFSYNGNELFQDAQSHHSIIHIYRGAYGADDPGWGGWNCYGGPNDGASCDPDGGVDTCDTANGGVCGSHFHPGVACLQSTEGAWGAPDFSTFGNLAPQFSGSQESTANFAYPGGVYGLLPLKGLIVWNSHAFNLTSQDTEMEAWLNMTYTDDRQWPAQGLFDDTYIFTQTVLPFQREEYCATHTFDNHTKLFQLTSHTHSRGVQWRYYGPPQTPCPPGSGGFANPACLPGSIADIFYESYDYSDPVVDNYDPPMEFTGTVNDRTIKFCAVFDNGFVNPETVKRRSTSPYPVTPFVPGGPCSAADAYCVGGTNDGTACFGSNANCTGGGVCDACELKGGVTTEDEMFISIGTYYIDTP